jgi:hypothetical protein
VPELGAGVVERALMHLGQVRLAELDDLAVDVDHDGAGDGGIPENLRSVAPSPPPITKRSWEPPRRSDDRDGPVPRDR